MVSDKIEEGRSGYDATLMMRQSARRQLTVSAWNVPFTASTKIGALLHSRHKTYEAKVSPRDDVDYMDFLRCVVERITYQNEQNGYTVIKCKAKGYDDLVTVIGNMPDVHVGSVLSLQGFWRMNEKYGRQFSAEKREETLPATAFGIEKYLGSGLTKESGRSLHIALSLGLRRTRLIL